jgi:beta-lactamase regulating signal transducer with metallopeptidase domain
MNTLSNPLSYAIAWTVINSIWQGILLAFIAGIAVIIFHKKDANFKYTIYSYAQIALLISSFATFLYIYFQASNLILPQVNINDINTYSNGITDNNTTAAGDNSYHLTTNIISYLNSHLPLITLIWIVGLLLSLLRLIGNISYVHYLRSAMNFPADEHWNDILNKFATKLKLNKKIEILESALVRSPVVIGHLKPLILFPIGIINKLDTEDVEAILSHELAHVLRNDYLINILMNIVESLYYYHPAVWWLSSQTKIERENSCDDIAINLCGNKVAYAKSLVTVQEMVYYSSNLAMSFGGEKPKSELAKRVLRLMAPDRTSINLSEKYATTSVIVILLMMLSFAAQSRKNDSKLNQKNEPFMEGAFSQSSSYLKYCGEGSVDSLFLPEGARNGMYKYNDDLQDVVLTVHDNFVVQFNINGLEVSGKDIPKFSNIIIKALNENFANVRNSNEESANEDQVNQESSHVDNISDEEQAEKQNSIENGLREAIENKLRGDGFLTNLDKEVHFSLNAYNAMVNDKILSKTAHDQYLKVYSKMTGKAMESSGHFEFQYTEDRNSVAKTKSTHRIEPPIPIPHTPPAPPTNFKSVSKEYAQLIKQRDLDAAQNRKQTEKDSKQTEKDKLVAIKERITAEKDRLTAEEDSKVAERDSKLAEGFHSYIKNILLYQ